MPKIREITVRELSTTSISVTWSIENTTEDLDNYSFIIFRSNSPKSGFVAISGLLNANAERDPTDYDYFQTSYHFVDTAPNLFAKHRKFYYKIAIVDLSGQSGTEELDMDAVFSDEDPI